MKKCTQAFVTTDLDEIDFENKTFDGIDTPVTMKDGKLHFEQGDLSYTVIRLVGTSTLSTSQIAGRELSKFGFKMDIKGVVNDFIIKTNYTGSLDYRNFINDSNSFVSLEEIRYLIFVESDRVILNCLGKDTFYARVLAKRVPKDVGKVRVVAYNHQYSQFEVYPFYVNRPRCKDECDMVIRPSLLWEEYPESLMGHLNQVISDYPKNDKEQDLDKLWLVFNEELGYVRSLFPEEWMVLLHDALVETPHPYPLDCDVDDIQARRLFDQLVTTSNQLLN